MTFIDWSDREGMFGLLLDFIADERADCVGDPERQRFLSELLARVEALEVQLEARPAAAIEGLLGIHRSVDPEFESDPVMTHIRDCVEELERIDSGAC